MCRKYPKIVFVLPDINYSGGITSVLNLSNELILMGVDVKIISFKDGSSTVPILTKPILIKSVENSLEIIPYADLYVATFWTTAYDVEKICKFQNSKSAYFIQDYEVFFYPESEMNTRNKVIESYNMINNKFAKTQWIIDKVNEHGHKVQKINPGVNLNLFYPLKRSANSRPLVVAMTRRSSPQRATDILIESLKILKMKYEQIDIKLFGEDPNCSQNLEYEYIGKLNHKDLVGLYQKADVYVDASHFHGFGRPGVEAMACGCALVTTNSGGVSEYAFHEKTAMIAEVGNPNDIADKILSIFNNEGLRQSLILNGLDHIQNYNEEIAARQFLDLASSWTYDTEQ